MPNLTNKQTLDLILRNSNELKKEQFDFAAKVSAFMNKQNDFNSAQTTFNNEIKIHLESNPKTHQKGLVEQVHDNTEDINILKIDKKVTAGKISVAGLIFTAIGATVLKALGLIKFIF